jgi:hypothetical protein
VIVLVRNQAEATFLAPILDAAAQHFGDRAPSCLSAYRLVVIGEHSTALGVTPIAKPDALSDRELMSYTEAASLLDCSTSTIGRRVRAGHLERKGRKVTTASVRRYLEMN